MKTKLRANPFVGLLVTGACLVVLVGCNGDSSAAPPGPAEAEEQANRDLLHDYHVEVWEEGHWDRASSYLGPGFVAHSVPILPDGQTPGPDFFPRWVGAFSDLVSHEDAILSGGDRVSLQWTITATHSGDFFGIEPTGRKVRVSGMDVLRVEDGKFVEQWGGVADQMDDAIQQITSP